MPERISEAEQVVMEVLWDDAPLAAQEVAQRVDPARGWSAATVKTLLSRLLAKGVIGHEEEGRRYRYRPLVARGAFAAGESRRLIDRLFGGRITPLVAHLAEHQPLGADEIAELEALLREMKP